MVPSESTRKLATGTPARSHTVIRRSTFAPVGARERVDDHDLIARHLEQQLRAGPMGEQRDRGAGCTEQLEPDDRLAGIVVTGRRGRCEPGKYCPVITDQLESPSADNRNNG
jgi:hypothetical protein